MKILEILFLLIVYGISVIGWLIYNWFNIKHWKTITIRDLLGFDENDKIFMFYFPFCNTFLFLMEIIMVIVDFIVIQWKKFLNIKIKDKTK